MGRLKTWVGLVVLAWLVGCQTGMAPSPQGSPTQSPSVGARPGEPQKFQEIPRFAPVRPGFAPAPATEFLPLASPLDLESWPFGWVDDDQASRLGLVRRFWSDHRPLWRQALDPKASPALVIRRLEALYSLVRPSEEAFRAAWHLWRVYGTAGLGDEARSWLDKAAALRFGPVTALERSWDQAFRLHDDWGARALWAAVQGPMGPDDTRKARLLKQHLYLGDRALTDMGADGYVSTLVLDQDDLWAGTWNGAVVRWSLTTGTIDLVLGPGPTVAPIKLMAVTGWFIYAFQDQALLRYSKVTGTWRPFSYPPGWTGLRVQGVVSDGEESLWVAYLGQGLWHWDRGEWTLVDAGGGGPFLNALASDGAGGFWVGTKDRGLWSWKDGIWTPVPADGVPPDNISVVQPSPQGTVWAVGTWGQGLWTLSERRLRPVSGGKEFVAAVAWNEDEPLWGTLDEGIVSGQGSRRTVLGPLDGLPPGGVTALVVWEGRWIWGTSGQGLGWWSEHENPALFR